MAYLRCTCSTSSDWRKVLNNTIEDTLAHSVWRCSAACHLYARTYCSMGFSISRCDTPATSRLALSSALQVCCRRGFPDVIAILDRVVANMAGMPPGTELDMNNVTLRIALDVTGMVGFAKDFRTCASFQDSGTDELFTIIQKSGCHGNPA